MPEQITEIFQYNQYSLFVVSTYDPWLILLSIFIAILASFMGFQVASQAQNAPPIRKNLSLLIGSLVLGGGVWSMHFIGMLALDLCTNISYQFDLTAVSVLPAIIASWIALNLITRKEIKSQELILGGILVGSGIGTMHYVGMAAMEMAPLLRYNMVIFVISILVAITLAILALWIRFGLEQKITSNLSVNSKVTIASCVMGAAITSMHYTGMAAARFVLPLGLEISAQTSEISTILALSVTAITVVLILLVLGANLIFRYKDISTAAMNNECRLIATMNTAIDGIITINSHGIIISVNNAVSTLLGWQTEELLGNNVRMIVPMPDQHHHDQYIHNYVKTRKAKIIGTGREVEALTKNGEKIPVRLGIGEVELNKEIMFVAFISDLRERKAMETSLRKKESKIRSLVTNIPGIAYRCLDKPGWPNIFINDEVEKMLGYPANEFLLPNPLRSIADFVHPDDINEIINTDFRAQEGYQLEFRVIDRYNNIKWVLGHGRALKAEDSDEYYLDGFIMDITDRKKMESAIIEAKEKAEQAAATRSAFLANMSHEIRTPMNSIIGFSDILLDEELSNHHRKQLNTINQSAKSLLHILNDVLDSAKLDKGKFQLEYRDFSLVEEVDSVVSTLWLQAQNKGLDINLNIDKECQRFYNGVPDRVRQVLTNLIGNAIKFTEQGNVTINIKTVKGNSLLFTISDTGIGMTADQLTSIFDAFAQADESMSRRFGGTGLGTTISKQLVELMGGSITASSKMNEGSTFEFCIPIKTAKYPIQPNTKNYTELNPLKILIVDDIEQNIDLLSLILKRNQHTVFIARDGQQALAKMHDEKLDLVLMDIQMPVMDGLTAAQKRREYEAKHGLPRLPIIALTASVLPRDKESAEQAGMDGFANKPIDIQQLTQEINNTLAVKKCEIIAPQVAHEKPLSIAIDKGVALWGSKTTLFNEIIRFIYDSKADINSLTTLVQDNKWKALENFAHKYKGVTGNLALNRLMLMFSELEQVARKRIANETTLPIKDIEEEIISLISSTNKMGKEIQQSQPQEDQLIATDELLKMLLQLEKSVLNNEFDELLLETLQVTKSAYSNEVDNIITSCNDFEFEIASSRIALLIASLTSKD